MPPSDRVESPLAIQLRSECTVTKVASTSNTTISAGDLRRRQRREQAQMWRRAHALAFSTRASAVGVRLGVSVIA
jgi:hypothetical protein